MSLVFSKMKSSKALVSPSQLAPKNPLQAKLSTLANAVHTALN